MKNLIPPIGVKGKFTFRTPYDTVINSKYLEVVELIKLKEFTKTNANALNLVYRKYGINDDVIKKELENDVVVIKFRDETGITYYASTSYLISVPETSGVIFEQKYIIVDFGNVPVNLDLTLARDEIKDIIKDLYGLNPIVYTESGLWKELKSYDEYDQFELNRKSNITKKTTCRQRLQELEIVLDLYKDKVKYLLEVKKNENSS